MDMRLEVVVLPVSDVDRAKAFYTGLGWRLDADFATGPGFRVVQVTTRLPGRAVSALAAYDSVAGLADALRRAAAAHGKHEEEIGQPDPEAVHGALDAAATAQVDVAAALAYRDFMVSDHTDAGQVAWLAGKGIDLIRGFGRLAGPGVVEVDGTRYTARDVVLANGSDPVVPPVPGLRELDGLWSNREVTAMSSVPRRLLILGGGPVGAEMAQAVRRLGGSVALVEGASHVLETVGATFDASGVRVDARLRAADRLWAIGDVTGIRLLTHVGKYQGEVVASNLLGSPREANYEAVPDVVYTDPQAAAVGSADGRFSVTVALADVAKTATYSHSYASSRGFLTLVSDGARLTGGYALGPEAGEWMQQATLAIRARVPLDVLRDVIQPFPTFSEVFVAGLKALRAQVAASREPASAGSS